MILFLIASAALWLVAGAWIWWPLRQHALQPDAAVSASALNRWGAGLLAGLAAVTVGLYAWLGTPGGLNPEREPVAVAPGPAAQRGEPNAPFANAAPAGEGGAPQMSPAQIEGMVQRLALRLQNQPDDVAGWRMLVRSYETLGRFEEAAQAWRRLFALAPPDADQLTSYAVTLGMSLNQTLAGEPEQAINQALKLNPDHVQALALSGSAAFEQRDYARAVKQWRRILSLTPADAPVRASIEAHIAKAESLARGDAKGASGNRRAPAAAAP